MSHAQAFISVSGNIFCLLCPCQNVELYLFQVLLEVIPPVMVVLMAVMMRIIWRIRMLWLWFGLVGRAAQRVPHLTKKTIHSALREPCPNYQMRPLYSADAAQHQNACCPGQR